MKKPETEKQRIVMEKGTETALNEMKNDIYAATAPWTEAFEHAGKINGNGHHMAQKIISFAEKLIKERIE